MYYDGQPVYGPADLDSCYRYLDLNEVYSVFCYIEEVSGLD
ncbi:hypothetical protein [Sigmofec virus UA08Rod_5349]|uniref:Uncharacterized protein n=1 Tax=Sigmofec virus UA08Rod_5349 TaxID=2929421 RepID=A0A976N1V5_9VIRU|nr:hypothetical protein [Sigmofec virus UA08Rod_5349]